MSVITPNEYFALSQLEKQLYGCFTNLESSELGIPQIQTEWLLSGTKVVIGINDSASDPIELHTNPVRKCWIRLAEEDD